MSHGPCAVFFTSSPAKTFINEDNALKMPLSSQVCLCLCSIIVKEVQFDKRHPAAIDIWIAAANVSYWLQFETLTRDHKPPLSYLLKRETDSLRN